MAQVVKGTVNDGDTARVELTGEVCQIKVKHRSGSGVLGVRAVPIVSPSGEDDELAAGETEYYRSTGESIRVVDLRASGANIDYLVSSVVGNYKGG